MADTIPDTEPNPGQGAFSWFAYILFHMRNSLEEIEPGRLPRWVRIARGGEHAGEGGDLANYIGQGVDAILEAFPVLLEVALDLEEILYQADAAAALGQSIFDALSAAFDARVRTAVQRVLPPSDATTTALNVMQGISNGFETASDVLDFVPSPEDVWIIGHQLYRMLCIVQRPFPREQNGEIDTDAAALTGPEHIDLTRTGKIRLCTWSYRHSMMIRDVAEGADPEDSEPHVKNFSFGSRRLFEGTLATRASMVYTAPLDDVRLFDFNFGPAAPHADNPNNRPGADAEDYWTTDIAELITLLQKRGYGTGEGNGVSLSPDLTGKTALDDDFERVLMQFQVINDLPITGEVDNSTINRLLNLDFERFNVRRAKRYDEHYPWPWTTTIRPLSGYMKLVNPGADDYRDENVALERRGTRYAFYPVRPLDQIDASDWREGQGWISDNNVTRGFVALQTRLVTSNSPSAGGSTPESGRFDGGRWSEGDSASGRYFWSARHTEPWEAGRSGNPDQATMLFPGPKPTAGAISRMYQWLPLDALEAPGQDYKLLLWCSALQRSLFSDRGLNGLPDQGRVKLELYDGQVNTRRVRPGTPLASAVLEAFPDHTDMPFIESPNGHPIDAIDSKRVWYYRQSELVEVPANATMACLVVEGIYQSAWDIDGYFDDFRVGFRWQET